MNNSNSELINTPLDFKKHCCKCGVNGSVRKWTFVFRYSFKAKLCLPCIESIGSPLLAKEWLEKNCLFDKTGNLIGFEGGQKNE